MDKKQAIKLSLRYLKKLRDSKMKIAEAWLFGSYVNNTHNQDSDIDLAIFLDSSEKNDFDTEIRLMSLRTGKEIFIEPHSFNVDEHNPFITEILNKGQKIL